MCWNCFGGHLYEDSGGAASDFNRVLCPCEDKREMQMLAHYDASHAMNLARGHVAAGLAMEGAEIQPQMHLSKTAIVEWGLPVEQMAKQYIETHYTGRTDILLKLWKEMHFCHKHRARDNHGQETWPSTCCPCLPFRN